VGEVVIAQARFTVPVNEFDGVTVMVEVLPDVAPGVKLMLLGLLERVKLVLPAGASQKPEHPASSGVAINSSRAQYPIFIAAPLLASGS
jgi:hypothetical protein